MELSLICIGCCLGVVMGGVIALLAFKHAFDKRCRQIQDEHRKEHETFINREFGTRRKEI